MTDTAQPTRVEPTLGSAPAPSDSPALSELRAAVEAPAGETRATVGSATPSSGGMMIDRAGLDQLSRIEEKAARIEEKYARTEALIGRLERQVEQTTTRAGELARHADLIAVRAELEALARRTRRLPGFGTILLVALVSILLTVAGVVAATRYGIPGMLPR
jgi:hypothetical protein